MTVGSRKLYVAEPAPAFVGRPPLVVDSSVLCAMLFEEPTRDLAVQRMTGHTLHAPWLIQYEVVSVAVKKQALGWPEASVTLALVDFANQQLELHATDVHSQYELARRYGLSAYDAAYLWLAAEMNATLATFDQKLGRAAQKHLGAPK